jgi:alginate O-acetyltransferase complex protein AlgI
MVFSSPIFLLIFLPLLLLVYALTPRALKNTILLGASLLFYAWGESFYVLIMLVSIAANYVAGRMMASAGSVRRERLILAASIVVNLGLLGFFKYANFLVANLNVLLRSLEISPLRLDPVHLPIGISFFTFQAMSYVIDVYRRDARVQRNPIDLALYIALFPQLIAGPIVRYHDIAAQLKKHALRLEDFTIGVRQFIIGLGKKVLIANTLALPADSIFALPAGDIALSAAWLGIVCYTLQIYFDFSGYSDMAIGLGRMLGFRFLENFNYPYVARSMRDFWKRWHISLSNWFRDYLYIPLGGSRRSASRTYVNLAIVFLLCGLWHGASWTFVLWGLLHGTFLIIERLGLESRLRRLPAVFGHVYVIAFLVVSWTFFRADNLPFAVHYLGALVGLGQGSTPHTADMYLTPLVGIVLLAGIMGATPWLPRFVQRFRSVEWRTETDLSRVLCGTGHVVGAVSLFIVLMLSVMWLAAGTYNPFIYFRF